MATESSKRRRKQRRKGDGASVPAQSAEPETPAKAAGPAPQGARRRRPVDDEPPPAPWGSFPLVELTVLIGIVMLILGLVVIGGERGTIFILTGLALASVAGVEVSIREHFAGYRSHTLILAGFPAAVVLGFLFYAGPAGLPPIARAAIGLAVFAGAAYLLTAAFRRRSGGHAFRFSGLFRR